MNYKPLRLLRLDIFTAKFAKKIRKGRKKALHLQNINRSERA